MVHHFFFLKYILLSNQIVGLGKCLEVCRSRLDRWNRSKFGHVGRTIADLQKCLEWLELQPSSPTIIRGLRSTRIDLNIWLKKEDAMWLQCSRINWMQSGDKNTQFFHAKASACHSKNIISSFLDSRDVWQEDESKVEEIAVDCYQYLFTSSNLSDFAELFQAVNPRVSSAMNKDLTRDFTANEVR